MKYEIFHQAQPDPGQPVYFMGPLGIEVLGRFLGGTRFDAQEGKPKGYYAKHWRPLEESEMLLVKELTPMEEGQIVREKPQKSMKKEKKPKIKHEKRIRKG